MCLRCSSSLLLSIPLQPAINLPPCNRSMRAFLNLKTKVTNKNMKFGVVRKQWRKNWRGTYFSFLWNKLSTDFCRCEKDGILVVIIFLFQKCANIVCWFFIEIYVGHQWLNEKCHVEVILSFLTQLMLNKTHHTRYMYHIIRKLAIPAFWHVLGWTHCFGCGEVFFALTCQDMTG